jgi:hypothetical protein
VQLDAGAYCNPMEAGHSIMNLVSIPSRADVLAVLDSPDEHAEAAEIDGVILHAELLAEARSVLLGVTER